MFPYRKLCSRTQLCHSVTTAFNETKASDGVSRSPPWWQKGMRRQWRMGRQILQQRMRRHWQPRHGCLEGHLSRAWEIRTFAQWQSLYWQLRRPRRLLQQSFRLRNDGDRRNQGKGTHHGNPVATATAHTGGATRGLHAASPLRSGIYQRRNPMAIYIYIYIHIYSHVCNHIYIYIYIHMYVTIHMVSMHIYIHIHIYINTHMDIKTLSNLVFSTSTPFIWKSSLLRHEMSVSDSSTKFKLLHQYNMTWHFSTRWHVSKVNEVLRMLRIRM